MLPVQIHVGSMPSEERFDPITNTHSDAIRSYHAWGFDKPHGGLWTSTKNEYGCDWLRFLHRDRRKHTSLERGGYAWEVKPKDDIDVFVLDDDEDLELLRMCYPCEGGRYIDWPALAEDFDAIHVKHYMCLEAWDCETVVWFNMDAIAEIVECGNTKVHVSAVMDVI